MNLNKINDIINDTTILDLEQFEKQHAVAPKYYITDFIWKNLFDKDILTTGGQEYDAIRHYIDDWYGFLRDDKAITEHYYRVIMEAFDKSNIKLLATEKEKEEIIDYMIFQMKENLQRILDMLKGGDE